LTVAFQKEYHSIMPTTTVRNEWELFRRWLEDNELTIAAFARSVPCLAYSTVAKWRSPNCHPQRINSAAAAAIREVHPDCPLARVQS
jgi:hypothetical protein